MPLKSPAELLEGDDRQRHWCGIAELHGVLAEIELSPAVPENVRNLFDTARNLALCCWFVYEFHPIAELTGFLALEAAVKARARSDSPELAKEKSFSRLMKRALEEGWIAEERISGRREIARARVEYRKSVETIRRMKELGLETASSAEATEEEIEREGSEMKVIGGICEAAIRLRNSLAHGEPYLDPGSWRRLRITADLINQLFSEKGTTPAS